MTERIALIDTNVLLHFTRLDDPAWAEHLPGPCRFVVPSAVISELDKHKESPVARLQRRARAILPWLEEHDGKELRDGYTLELRPTEPHRALGDHPELDRTHPDDRIVATALELRDGNPTAQVMLISDDTTPRIKARQQGLDAAAPPSALRLPPSKTQEELELEAAQRRLQALESRFPQLSLFVPGFEQPHFRVGPAQQVDVDARLQDALSREEAELGSSCTQDYLDRYAAFVRKSDTVMTTVSRCIRVPLALRNDGTHHADDILVELEWSTPPSLLEELPEFPRAPERPRSFLDFTSFRPPWLGHLPHIDLASRIRGEEPTGPTGITGEGRATYRLGRLVHRTEIPLDPLLLQFDSLETAKGFSLRWTIHAAHQPEAATGTLEVQVTTDREDRELWTFLGIDDDDVEET